MGDVEMLVLTGVLSAVFFSVLDRLVLGSKSRCTEYYYGVLRSTPQVPSGFSLSTPQVKHCTPEPAPQVTKQTSR